ncbi:hypothetical protein [Sphingomonas melonis]|uniref:hypothetical protein n=1 Tax=Sphingomonas melonis TaxID=152682 RepID=UPI0036CD93EB
MAQADSAIPDFPFFAVDDATLAFGCGQDTYVNRRGASALSRLLRDEAKAFSSLFFCGGTLEQHGFTLKPEYKAEGTKTIRALMKSWAPAHEAKEATVALALHHWCDRVPVADEEAAA